MEPLGGHVAVVLEVCAHELERAIEVERAQLRPQPGGRSSVAHANSSGGTPTSVERARGLVERRHVETVLGSPPPEQGEEVTMAEHAEVREWEQFQADAFDFAAHDGAVLRCPACQGTDVHLCGVRTIVGVRDRKQAAMIERVRDGDFRFEEAADPAVGRRGAQLEIGVNCESCGGVIVIALQFHKGTTHARWKRLGDFGATIVDLWRD